MHGAKTVVEVIRNRVANKFPGLGIQHRGRHVTHDSVKQVTHDRYGLSWVGNGPPHQGDEKEAKQHEQK